MSFDSQRIGICAPFKLSPVGKDYLWGGTRLRDNYGKPIDMQPLAESWECSVHPDGMCRVHGGVFDGRTLFEVLKENPQMLGTHPISELGFPILVKLIDAAKDLSVQVHPNDEFAMVHENQLGKTEMWYVLDAKPGAQLVYGFSHEVTREMIREGIQSGRLTDYLQYVPVHKGDVYFIEPGTIHAIGSGVLIAEIQESSNVTYRVYDYGRTDKDGKQRELHIEKALQVLTLNRASEVRQRMRVTKFRPGYAIELLCRCKYFQVERVSMNGDFTEIVGENSFQVYLVSHGEGVMYYGTDQLALKALDTVFVPAAIGELRMSGTLELLKIGC